MIVVIADDLSGAAELAGAATCLGLRAEVHTRFQAGASADVVAVDANTRSLPQEHAAHVTREITLTIAAANPEWVYKKCDSVLRGNVLVEIRAVMTATGRARALLISANPARGRVIRGGRYFVNGESLEMTAFAHDPEHPRQTAVVAELLGGDLARVQTPDAETAADLDHYAAVIDASTLPAGGVEFFEALLRREMSQGNHHVPSQPSPVPNDALDSLPKLFVCGSAAAWANGRMDQCRAHGIAIETMPDEAAAIEVDDQSLHAWSARIAAALSSGRSVMVAIGRARICSSPPPATLAERLARAVAGAVRGSTVSAICAEGGATAAAVARELGWERFTVGGQLAGGAVNLRPVAPNTPAFIIKVGSYDWPADIWER
ncbi:MAG TPA: four-carbon acid sugar kinase family protein [Opitutaceae bacterium]|nr:four-carbon acid sugar kinase family protein [Opitutaceae bacterium]